MTLHDSYARFTPYELAFPARDLLDELIVGIEEEAGRRGMDSSDLNAFFTMERVAAFVREIQGTNALPETVHQYVALSSMLCTSPGLGVRSICSVNA